MYKKDIKLCFQGGKLQKDTKSWWFLEDDYTKQTKNSFWELGFEIQIKRVKSMFCFLKETNKNKKKPKKTKNRKSHVLNVDT